MVRLSLILFSTFLDSAASCLTLPFFLGFQSPIISPSNPQVKISQPISQRLTIFIFAFAPVFVLLSLRDETLFFFSYIATLLLWSKVEGTLCEESQRERIDKGVEEKQRNGIVNGKEEKQEKEIRAGTTRTLRSSEIRTSLTFLFLLHVGFFGTGESLGDEVVEHALESKTHAFLFPTADESFLFEFLLFSTLSRKCRLDIFILSITSLSTSPNLQPILDGDVTTSQDPSPVCHSLLHLPSALSIAYKKTASSFKLNRKSSSEQKTQSFSDGRTRTLRKEFFGWFRFERFFLFDSDSLYSC